MEYGLIGEHLGHSYSCEIHSRIGGYRYELRELAPDELGSFLAGSDFKGINVTIPYKKAVFPYIYNVSEKANTIGAINTIVNKGGKLYGYNTDFYGMRAALEFKKISLRGRKVLILGTGGTSHTARAVAKNMGAASVVLVSREAKDGAVTYETAAQRHSDAEIIINTTPVGMYPNVGRAPIDIGLYPRLCGLMDAIYNPIRSDLVLDAEAAGVPAIGGLYMLAAQAVYASALFLEKTADENVITSAYEGVLCEKRNIVLVGMAGSGKTTIGKNIAAKLGRDFIDTDAEIVKKTGKAIPEIFESDGEAGFRRIESEVVAEVSMRSGCVISTGGGAVLDSANVRALKRSGIISFIDRDPNKLAFSSDRPLSQTKDAAIKLYKSRLQTYKNAADNTVVNDSTPAKAADAVINADKGEK